MADVQEREFGGHLFPYSEDLSPLARPVAIPNERITLKNSISVQPLEGADSTGDGAPGELTYRRYRRFLDSGAALVWAESIAVREDGRSYPNALWIHDGNLDAYKAFVDVLKSAHPDVPIIAQLTHSGRFSHPHGKAEPVIAMYNPHYDARVPLHEDYPVVSDDYLDRVSEDFVHAARLCREAGFDGVDVKACHGYLLSELLSCRQRSGRYGGSFENRTRMLLQTVRAIKAEHGADLLVASRICHADTLPYPYGFGMREDGSLEYDPAEPLRLVRELKAAGVNLVNVSVGRVTVNPEFWPTHAGEIPVDGTEDYFNRFFQGTRTLAQANPDVAFVGSCYTQMRRNAPQVAAGALASGAATIAGFGRMANAYPGFAQAMIEGRLDEKALCTLCGNCYKLLRSGTPTGCPIRDKEAYLPLLLKVLGKA